MVGAEVAGPTPAEFNGLRVERWPLVSWNSSFAQARCFRFAGRRSVSDSHTAPACPNRDWGRLQPIQ